MKIGLYFGSFNPIHIGHLIIANYVADNTDLDEIWMVVSPQNPLKLSKTLLNEYDRLNLVNIAISGNDRIKSCDIEFKLPKPSYTIDTLTYLEDKYPNHTFSIIMGSDSYQNIEKWKNYQILIEKYKLIIYQRPDNIILENKRENVLVLHAPLLDISATYIRQSIKNGKSVTYLLPDAVIAEIERNGYFRN